MYQTYSSSSDYVEKIIGKLNEFSTTNSDEVINYLLFIYYLFICLFIYLLVYLFVLLVSLNS